MNAIKAWALFYENDLCEVYSLDVNTRRKACSRAAYDSGHPWALMDVMGYRCVRVEVKEAALGVGEGYEAHRQ